MIDKLDFEKDEAKKIFDKVYSTFHYDLIKTLDWFTTPKGYLKNSSPYNLIKSGELEDLLLHIDTMSNLQ